MGDITKGLKILSIEAKDIYLSNLANKEIGYEITYSSGKDKGKYIERKFCNMLDYSLELIQLEKIYHKRISKKNFSFDIADYPATLQVINVTYRYSLKEFNNIGGNQYLKLGKDIDDVKYEDSVCIKDGELVSIVVDVPVENPIDSSLLGNYFTYKDGKYQIKSNPTVMSTPDLRAWTYANQFAVNGIQYCRYKRSSGSSRVGKCLFINKLLYPYIHKWELCGLKINEQTKSDLAAWEAYIALPLSSIVDTIEIDKKSILVIDDYESVFKDDVIEVSDKDGLLTVKDKKAKIKNNIWDGQSLMDKSLFGKYDQRGMLLLRNRFFKSACFNCNIQEWFKDNNITEISQLAGFTLANDISQIKLITTPSSIKYLKFGNLKNWLQRIDELFGIVKHDKPTHFFDGAYVQTNYQLLNTIQLSYEEVYQLVKPSLDYLDLIKSDAAFLRFHIKYNLSSEKWKTPALNKNDIVYKLLGLNKKFEETKLYAGFRQDLIASYVKNLRAGHILVDGTYATLLGNPIEMLQQSIGIFNGETVLGKGTVCTHFFPEGQILCCRSPHICAGNIYIPNNANSPIIDKYINMSNETIAINSINENVLQRLSGCDFDSDSVLITNNSILLNKSLINYKKFKVPTCNVSASKIKREFSLSQKTELDIKTSENQIGMIVNLSQELNTLLFHNLNSNKIKKKVIKDIYLDICKLAAMSGLEIDAAKKEFPINNNNEYKILKSKWLRENHGKVIKPYFFERISQIKGNEKDLTKEYICHDSTMDYLQKIINNYIKNNRRRKNSNKQYTPFHEILNKEDYNVTCVTREQVAKVLKILKEYSTFKKKLYSTTNPLNLNKYDIIIAEREKIFSTIGKMKFSKNTIIYLLKMFDREEYKQFYLTAFYILFGYPNSSFYKVIIESKEKLPEIKNNPNGNIKILSKKYQKKS